MSDSVDCEKSDDWLVETLSYVQAQMPKKNYNEHYKRVWFISGDSV